MGCVRGILPCAQYRSHCPDVLADVTCAAARLPMSAPVIPRNHVDIAIIQGGGQLRLRQRGAEFSIRLGRTELMNSRLSGNDALLYFIAGEGGGCT
jgi:hypothetical protein